MLVHVSLNTYVNSLMFHCNHSPPVWMCTFISAHNASVYTIHQRRREVKQFISINLKIKFNYNCNTFTTKRPIGNVNANSISQATIFSGYCNEYQNLVYMLICNELLRLKLPQIYKQNKNCHYS